MATIPKGELLTVHITLHAYTRTLHKMKAQINVYAHLCGNITADTSIRWTLHDTKPCSSDVMVYVCHDVWCFFVSLEIVFTQARKNKILQKGFV